MVFIIKKKKVRPGVEPTHAAQGFRSPATAGGRRSYETYYSRPAVMWQEGGHSYSAAFEVSCSCKHVYAHGYYYKDGVKTTLTAIKKSLERLEKED